MKSLFNIGSLYFSTYLIAQCMGYTVVGLGATWLNWRRHGNTRVLPDFGLWTFFGVLFGAHAAFAINAGLPFREAIRFLDGGYLSSGGIAGGAVAIVLYAAVRKIHVLDLCDCAAPFAAFAEVCGHTGCLLVGCCFGAPTAMPWGIRFPMHAPAWESQVIAGVLPATAHYTLPVHPLQFYNALVSLIAGACLIVFALHAHRRGTVALLFLVFSGAQRFLLQFFRGDDAATAIFGLRVTQWSALALALIAASLLAIGRWRRNRTVVAFQHQEENTT